MSVFDIDAEEWRSAKYEAERNGDDLVHPLDCKCRDCLREEYDAQEEHQR